MKRHARAKDIRDRLGVYSAQLWSRSADHQSPIWADLLDITALLYIQLADEMDWLMLRNYILQIYPQGVKDMDRQRELSEISRSLRMPDSKCKKMNETRNGLSASRKMSSGDLSLKGKCWYICSAVKHLTTSKFHNIYRQSQTYKSFPKFILIIVNQAPTDDAWLRSQTAPLPA